MIIAIYGKSCTGKTSVANYLAKIINAHVLHCSEEIKMKAIKLGCQPNELPLNEHSTIDNKTRDIARKSNTDLIIEGGFLSYVLAGLSNVTFIELNCEDDIRMLRYNAKEGKHEGDLADLSERDHSDKFLCEQLYKDVSFNNTDVVKIDSTSRSAEDIAFSIAKIVGKLNDYKA